MADDKVNLVINEDDFTIGDLEDFEDITGRTFEDVLAGEFARDEDGNKKFDEKGRPLREVKMTAKVIKALIYITQRRINKAFTIEDARNVRLASITWADDNEVADPKEESASADA